MPDQKQKVLIVHNYYQIPGGEDTVVANEKKMLEDHGHEVVLYIRHNSELKELSKLQKILLPVNTIFNFQTYGEVKKLIKEQKIDLVHVHNTLNIVSPSVYYAAFACRVPIIQTVHNFRLLCPGATFFRDGHICEEFPECKVSKVHGQMKPAEKDAEMQRFVNGETQIMVATTVIEVGVNVPNASVMVIENAERFGLSQLHQLRGRVGRGADQSYCILVTSYKLSEETRKRLEIMVQTCDGFEIAEADLKLRGPGDLEGTQQSGVAFDLKIADIARDGQLLQYVRQVAMDILEQDPTGVLPENELLWRQLQALRKTHVNWAAIS